MRTQASPCSEHRNAAFMRWICFLEHRNIAIGTRLPIYAFAVWLRDVLVVSQGPKPISLAWFATVALCGLSPFGDFAIGWGNAGQSTIAALT